MDSPWAYVALALSYAGSVWCWRRVWRSQDLRFFKVALTVVAGIPFMGPFLYFFVDMPPRRPRDFFDEPRPRRKPSALLQRWNEREHVYLAWTSAIFWGLAVVAYWMNDWSPGNVHAAPVVWAYYTDVDVIFFALLVGAVLTFGAALRVKLFLTRQLAEASNLSASGGAEARRSA